MRIYDVTEVTGHVGERHDVEIDIYPLNSYVLQGTALLNRPNPGQNYPWRPGINFRTAR